MRTGAVGRPICLRCRQEVLKRPKDRSAMERRVRHRMYARVAVLCVRFKGAGAAVGASNNRSFRPTHHQPRAQRAHRAHRARRGRRVGRLALPLPLPTRRGRFGSASRRPRRTTGRARRAVGSSMGRPPRRRRRRRGSRPAATRATRRRRITATTRRARSRSSCGCGGRPRSRSPPSPSASASAPR